MPQELRDYRCPWFFDPPRQSAQAQVQQLAASKIPVVDCRVMQRRNVCARPRGF